ncbi:MAG: CaiB/BaiF CoA transferase family protein [Candidatus Binataceae bacterium]
MEHKGILSGIRVIDCGTYIAGPASATVMSDFGADVIKIERPQGDLWRLFSRLPGVAKSDLDWCWILTSRNKRSVALDLGNPAGRDALIELVKGADVFVTNYQAQILKKFRLTWEDLRPLNDRLIYAHLTGYGDRGDDADEPAFDALAYWARSGLMMSVVGRDGTPGGARPGMGDHPTAMSMFGAIMLGLYNRERSGHGSKVGTSLLASGAWANACDLQAKFLNAVFPPRVVSGPPPNPLAAGYITSDGKLFLLVQLDPDHEFPRLCEALGMPDLATSDLFSNDAGRSQNAAELHAILQSQFEARDIAGLRKLFKQYDIKWSLLPLLDDVADDPQLRAADAVIEMDHPTSGKIETINSPVFIQGAEKCKPVAPPEIGAHTREVLREIGYSEASIEKMIQSGAATAAN